MPIGNRALQSCYITWAGFPSNDQKKGHSWLTSMSGHVTTISNKTTHVIVSEKAWKDGHKVIDQANAENEKRSQSAAIKFVTFTWVEDCSSNRVKKSEGPYLCERLWAASKRANSKAGGKRAEQHAVGSRTQKGLIKDMLVEQTDKHLDERSRREIDEDLKRQKKLEKREEQAKSEEEESRRVQADMFQRGAKKARNEIFTDNHHIYMDTTGFRYDVPITKVDPRNNRNERYNITLQIYESNAEPHTYATNLHFAGTSTAPQNNLLCAMGTGFPTAYHKFKSAFEQYTTVEWNDRVIHAIGSADARKRERGQTGSSLAEVSRAGVPVASEIAAAVVKTPKRFEELPFEYHPPRFGPRGSLPEDKMAELAQFMVSKKGKARAEVTGGKEIVKAWMDGNAPVPVIEAPETSARLTANGDFDFGTVSRSAQTVQMPGIGEHEFDNLMDETYPFEQLYDTNSFDITQDLQPSGSVEATQRPSFNLPPSIIAESFQPGTQEVSKPQLVTRALGLSNELMDNIIESVEQKLKAQKSKVEDDFDGAAKPIFDEEMQIEQEIMAEEEIPKKKKLDLGTSTLGKRKAETRTEKNVEESGKKVKSDNGMDEDLS